ncbi:hypothetical protein ACSBR2_007754 [Camellia fascicularis]
MAASLQVEVENLKNLGYLSVSSNMLSGEIPGTLGSCVMLETLYMHCNFFQGTILSTLASLRGIQFLDLSRNNLSGRIPEYFAAFNLLQNLNLSYNHFEGAVPTKGVDYQGNDFKALVYDFMINGSLEDWLHPVMGLDLLHNEPKKLDLHQRLNISIDVAYALDYLHHDCQSPIIHCDRKPSNILLNEDMIGHVGDFGLARFLQEANHNFNAKQGSSTGVRGTIGYIAPEYGMGSEVSAYGDIYSFGILMLEMFTGKRTTDEMFKDGLSLHSFVKEALPGSVLEILDPILFQTEGEEEESIIMSEKTVEWLSLILEIGVNCSSELPRERTNINDVAAKLHFIKDTLLEYAMGSKESTEGDVYSYGILLLEMFTGKRPIDDMFKESFNLHNLVRLALPHQVADVADPMLFRGGEEETSTQNLRKRSCSRSEKIRDCLISIMQIGVNCSAELPKERMNISAVVAQLHSIKNIFLGTMPSEN